MRALFTAVVALAALTLWACSTAPKVPNDVTKAADDATKATETADKAKAEAEAKELEARKTVFATRKDAEETKYQELFKQINDADAGFQAWLDKMNASAKGKKDKSLPELTKMRDELKAQIEPLTKSHDEVVAWFEQTKDNPKAEDETALGEKYGQVGTKQAELAAKYIELKTKTEALSTKYKITL